MVKIKALLPVLGAAALLLSFVGCEKLPSTARSVNGSGLLLSAPNPEGIKAKFTLSVALEYRVASGSDVLSGSVSLNQLQSTAGPINIPLPHDGQWLVSAEWINLGTTPLYIGADEAVVTGPTPFALSLGTVSQVCYRAHIANPGSNAGVPDLFTFDTDTPTYSPATITTDIQALLGTDPLYPSMVLQPTAGPAPEFAYLGNGDWLNFTDIPAGTAFYNDSLAAKRAFLGSTAVMAVNDVYAIKLSPSTTAWIQVDSVTNTGATDVDFYFRLNRHGYHYLKFDVTAYGDANCNTSGATLY